MASYPAIPARIWWDLRRKFKQAPPRGEVNSAYLSSALGVGDKQARNLMGPIRSAGLIGEDGRMTDRAQKWRMDDTYAEACQEIVEEVYPDGLKDVAPPPNPDPATVQRWFLRETGAGENRAYQLASFYLLVANADLSAEDAQRRATEENGTQKRQPRRREERAVNRKKPESEDASAGHEEHPPQMPTLNLAVQVYIDKDMSAEQVDHVFASMARHLYGKE